MRTTTSANIFTAHVSDLLLQLESMIGEVDRCEEMLSRLNTMDQSAKIPEEIQAYIKGYLPDLDVSTEGIGTAITAIREILRLLKKTVLWIIDKLKEIFYWFMDGTYRTRKEMIELQRKLLVLSTNRTLTNRVEQYVTTVVQCQELEKVIYKNQCLIDLIKSVAGVTQAEHMEILLRDCKGNAGIEVQDSILIDNCAAITPLRNVTYLSAGWTIDSMLDIIKKEINTLSGVQELKKTHERINNDVKVLDKAITDAMHSNVTVESVNELQRQTATKMRIAKVIGYSINILLRRTDTIARILRAIEQDVTEQIPKDPTIRDIPDFKWPPKI